VVELPDEPYLELYEEEGDDDELREPYDDELGVE